MRLHSGDKHHLTKSADRKAHIRKAFFPLTGLICAFRSADFLRCCLSPSATSRTISFSISNSFLVFRTVRRFKHKTAPVKNRLLRLVLWEEDGPRTRVVHVLVHVHCDMYWYVVQCIFEFSAYTSTLRMCFVVIWVAAGGGGGGLEPN